MPRGAPTPPASENTVEGGKERERY